MRMTICVTSKVADQLYEVTVRIEASDGVLVHTYLLHLTRRRMGMTG
jgi:hypothetical protein